MSALIDVENLTLQFRTDEGLITAVEDVSFSIARGEVMGLVGESGSGKSVTAKALMHLNARNAVYGPNSRITLHTETEIVELRGLDGSLSGLTWKHKDRDERVEIGLRRRVPSIAGVEPRVGDDRDEASAVHIA